MSVRIMLVDDHRMFREALRGQLAAEPGFEIVAEAGSGEEALQVAAEAAPDVAAYDATLLQDVGPVGAVSGERARHVFGDLRQVGSGWGLGVGHGVAVLRG